MAIFVAYDYNHTQICEGPDLGNVTEESMVYEEITGNKTYIIWKEEAA